MGPSRTRIASRQGAAARAAPLAWRACPAGQRYWQAGPRAAQAGPAPAAWAAAAALSLLLLLRWWRQRARPLHLLLARRNGPARGKCCMENGCPLMPCRPAVRAGVLNCDCKQGGLPSALTRRSRPCPRCGVASAPPPSGCCACRACCCCTLAALEPGAARFRLLLGAAPAAASVPPGPAAAGGRQKPGKLSAPASCSRCLLLTSGGEGGSTAPASRCCCWAGAGLASRRLSAARAGKAGAAHSWSGMPQAQRSSQPGRRKRAPSQAGTRTFAVQLQGGLKSGLLRLRRAGRLDSNSAAPVPAWLRRVASKVNEQAAHLQAHSAREAGLFGRGTQATNAAGIVQPTAVPAHAARQAHLRKLMQAHLLQGGLHIPLLR